MAKVTTPNEKNEPKKSKKPKFRQEEENYVSDEEFAEEAHGVIREFYGVYKDQAERGTFFDEAKLADRYYRCSRDRDTGDAQYENTKSNVASSAYFTRINTVVSNEADIYFPRDGDLPVKYEPKPLSDDYSAEEGLQIAKNQNLLLGYSFDADKMRTKVKSSLTTLNKYGQQGYAMEWDYRTTMKKERVVKRRDEEGRPISFGWELKRKYIANNPTLRVIQFENLFFDARIDGMSKQACVLERSYPDHAELWQAQQDELIENVGKLREQHLKPDVEENDAVESRKENADEASSQGEDTHLFEKWDVWVKLPAEIVDGKPVWDEEKYPPTWWWMTLVGDVQTTSAVPVRLRPNPYFHQQNPYNWVHSHEDDKDAYHLYLFHLMHSLIEEETTAKNQAIDNKTLINRAPWACRKGNIVGTDLKFDANKVIYLKDASTDAFRQLEVRDATGTTDASVARTNAEMDEVSNTGAAVSGQALGSRTSASESTNVFRQASKPMLAKARYQEDQLFDWMAFMIMELWRQYADPALTIAITQDDEVVEIKPAELWGDLNIRVGSVEKFEDTVTRRQEQNSFLQVILPVAQQVMGKDGLTKFIRELAKDRQLVENVNEVFPIAHAVEAERVAMSENESIIFQGIEDLPEQGEDHETHLRLHEAWLRTVKTLPPEEQEPITAGIQLMDTHIAIHKQMQAGGGQGAAPGGAGPQESPDIQEAAPTLEGDAQGDLIAGDAGGLGGF